MDEPTVACAVCGHRFVPRREGGDPLARCPVCNSPAPAAVPAAPAVDGTPGKLEIRRGATLDGQGRKCAGCGMTVEGAQTVCPHCGFDAAAGRYVDEMRADRRRRGRQAVLAAALIAAAAAAAVYSLRRFTTEPTEPPSSRPPDAAPTPIDRAEMLRRIEARLRADLDAKYPMLAPGDAAALELLTGQVVRGTYRGLLAGEAQIETGEGPRALPLDQLAPHSRVRVDADFRTGTIAHRARTEAGSGSASLSERPPSPP